MVARIDGGVAIRALDDCDAVFVRGIPRGSLEQVIFRVDALHVLGVPCLNSPRAIERTVDKFLASALLARAGVPTPRTITASQSSSHTSRLRTATSPSMRPSMRVTGTRRCSCPRAASASVSCCACQPPVDPTIATFSPRTSAPAPRG